MTYNHCPKCGATLEESGITTTRHVILTCSGCRGAWVRHFDVLEPIYGWYDSPSTEQRLKT